MKCPNVTILYSRITEQRESIIGVPVFNGGLYSGRAAEAKLRAQAALPPLTPRMTDGS